MVILQALGSCMTPSAACTDDQARPDGPKSAELNPTLDVKLF